MKLLFLDAYRNSNSRISKDTAGGYGTENDLGDKIFGKILSRIIKKSVFWPNLSFIQLMQEFYNDGNIVHYEWITGSEYTLSSDWDAVFVCNSIVCFETEIELVKNLYKQKKVKVFLCGTVAEHLSSKVPLNTIVLSGNYEFFLQFLKNSIMNLNDINLPHIKVPNGKAEELGVINWKSFGINNTKNIFLGGFQKFFPYITSRGCPYSCGEYCTYPSSQGKLVYAEPVFSVVNKFKKIAQDYPKSHVVFRDPVFSINLKYSKSLLKAIGDAKLNIDFSAELHLRNIDDEFINLCKYANVTWLKFGIESAIEDVRKSVNRFSVTNDVQKINIRKLIKAKIKTVGMFILAQPTDTVQTCEQTIDYACNLGLNIAQFSIFTPYPGTPYFDKNKNNLKFCTYEDFSQFKLVYKHEKISEIKARSLLEEAYRKFIFSKIKNKLHIK